MVKMSAIYQGEKHCEATHEPSSSHLVTDAPKDNNGKGEAFSPTDLMAISVGTCMLTTMAIHCEKENRPKAYPKVRILYPQDGMILAVDPAIPLANQKMPLLVEGEQKKKFSWRINGKTVVSAKEPYLWTPTPGHHTFELLSGNSATQKVQVIVK